MWHLVAGVIGQSAGRPIGRVSVFSSGALRFAVALLAAAALLAAVEAVPMAEEARAAVRCPVKVTQFDHESGQRFAQGGRIKRYQAAVDYPVGTTYDQSAKLVVGRYPAGAFPTLLSTWVGSRRKTGLMVQEQQPLALGAVNGDFFTYTDIPNSNGTTTRVPVARGPMVKDGTVLHADRGRQRVVGVDENLQPFAGMMGVLGRVRSNTTSGGAAAKIQGINWQSVQPGGVTVYTPEWQVTDRTPRPAGSAEWVINRHNKIVEIRTSQVNSGSRGAPVAPATRVLAFSNSDVGTAANGIIGNRARVRIKQSTSSGIPLRTAIGRGLPLVENGVAAPLGCDAYKSKASRPRTVVGWNKAGKWRTVTVPGRIFDGYFRNGGFGLANLAKLAKKAGLYNAYELDGGGSTTFHTRNNKGKWTRRDLYGLDTTTGTYEREVINGLAFVQATG